MNTGKDSGDISNLELSMRRLETRIESTKSSQKTNAERMESLHQTLEARLSAKDDTIGRIKDQSEWVLKQNDTLLKQLGFRWNLLTGLTTFVALAFSITLGYQIWRVEQVMDTKRALEDGTKVLAANAKVYSDVLATFAHADNLLTESNREFQRGEFRTSLVLAGTAIEFQRSTLSKHDV